MTFKNEIVPSGGLDQFGVPRYGNAAHSRHLGIEAEGVFKPLHGLELAGNFAWGKHQLIRFTEYDDAGTAVIRDGNPIALFPSVTANLRVAYTQGRFYAAISGQHVGKFCLDNGGCETPNTPIEAYNDPYTVLNANLRMNPKPHRRWANWALGFDVQNLLNQNILLHGNSDRTFFPLAKRNYLVTLRYKAHSL